ncbi:MAG: hypothetical protein WAM11_14780 [Cyanobium sp.]
MAFAKVGDRIGRTRTLLLTLVTDSLGPFACACACAANLATWMVCRLVASLGIGGLIGALLTVPIAERLSWRWMFGSTSWCRGGGAAGLRRWRGGRSGRLVVVVVRDRRERVRQLRVLQL